MSVDYFVIYDPGTRQVIETGSIMGLTDAAKANMPKNMIFITKELADKCGNWSHVDDKGNVVPNDPSNQVIVTTQTAQVQLHQLYAEKEAAGVELTVKSSTAPVLFSTATDMLTKYHTYLLSIQNNTFVGDSIVLLSLDKTPTTLTKDELKALCIKAQAYIDACTKQYQFYYTALVNNPGVDITKDWPSNT